MKVYADTRFINAYFAKPLSGLVLDLTKTDKEHPIEISKEMVKAFKEVLFNNKFIHVIEEENDEIKIVEREKKGQKIIEVKPNNDDVFFFDVRDKAIELGYSQKIFGNFTMERCLDYIKKYENDPEFKKEADKRIALRKEEEAKKLKEKNNKYAHMKFGQLAKIAKEKGFNPEINGKYNKENIMKFLKEIGDVV